MEVSLVISSLFEGQSRTGAACLLASTKSENKVSAGIVRSLGLWYRMRQVKCISYLLLGKKLSPNSVS